MRARRTAGVGAGAAIGASVLFAPSAEAATFTVTNLNDAGAGSLREAVLDANAAPGIDDVNFASGLSGTITLTTGPIDVYETARVNGPGASSLTVTANGASRVFYINANVNGAVYDPVSISGLTVTGGSVAGVGGGIFSAETDLTLSGMSVTGNTATGDFNGGGIYHGQGALTIEGSTVTNNTTSDKGGGLLVDGSHGSNAPYDDITIRDSVFSGNDAGDSGGGIYLYHPSGDLLIERTTISDNEAGDFGGGLKVTLYDEGNLTIDRSTISGNRTEAFGGGAFLYEVEGNTLIRNSTISGNRAVEHGGGIYFGTVYDDQTASITNSTIVDNVAGTGPGAFSGGGVYLYDDFEDTTAPIVENGPVAISSTIVANNSADRASDLGHGAYADGFAIGYSLFESSGDASGGPAQIIETPAGSNLLGVDPLLGPLAANGGPTQTQLPALQSPALDAGVANGLATDQRGLQRTFDAANVANRPGSDATDIGALERVAEGTCKGKVATALFDSGQPITGSDANDVIVGTDANDAISAGGGKDTVCAGKGNDKVSGQAGKDRLFGEAGKDKLRGGGGKDKLSGQAGADKLKGQAGKDTLKGGSGKDTLKGGAGKDRLDGGPGRDKLNGGPGKDKVQQ